MERFTGKVCDDRCKNEQEMDGRIFREIRNGLRPHLGEPDIPGRASEREREITRHIYI